MQTQHGGAHSMQVQAARDVHFHGGNDTLGGLRLPWKGRLPRDGSLYNILSWRYRLAPTIGRDDELDALLAWAEGQDSDPQLHWLCGRGGSGKTRLAAELCETLRGRGWTAGFVSWRDPVSLPRTDGGGGLCLVLDYPEENRARTLEWMTLLADLSECEQPIRAVLLSRRGLEDWEQDLQSAHVAHLCDQTLLRDLGPLGSEECVALFEQASRGYADSYDLSWSEVDAAAITEWRNRDPSVHGQPLFVTAAAVHAVLAPERALGLRGSHIIAALVKREIARLGPLGQALGLDERAVPRLCGLAVLAADGLGVDAVKRLAGEELALGLPSGPDAVRVVTKLPHWRDDVLHAPSPDLVAAGMLQTILDDEPDAALASEWLWTVMQDREVEALIDRLGRLCFDIDTLAIEGFRSDERRLDGLLAAMVRGNIERARAMAAFTYESNLPIGLTRLGVAVSEILVAAHRSDAEISPARYLPDLAMSLNNLSVHLSDAGRSGEALQAIQEAAEIRRELAKGNPARYLPDLAMSL
ncbi:MAG: tetratricopeptide repeat protein, partial [Proteobacteria bacterium]|nr:tetratricopeptide repeat protein [Pseudomonadota bacterium]